VTDEDSALLAQLLQKLAAEGLGVPRAPKAVFLALKGVVAQPTVELLVTQDGRDVLLTRRDDDDWSGWHMPGGFVGAGEDLAAACDRIARRELGTPARLLRLIGHYTWTDHPYASALSLLCVCELSGAPNDGQYFDPLPADLLLQHRALLQASWPEPNSPSR
jgi:ADP-ribose pyrophosphatase YjhB (NUDIX family)